MPIHKDKLRVVDIMSVDPVCVEANTGIRELARLFEEHQISGAPVVCTALDQCHDAGVCDPGTGLCSDPVKTDGAACSDGDSDFCNKAFKEI